MAQMRSNSVSWFPGDPQILPVTEAYRCGDRACDDVLRAVNFRQGVRHLPESRPKLGKVRPHTLGCPNAHAGILQEPGRPRAFLARFSASPI